MKFEITEIFKRSVTIELNNNEPYEYHTEVTLELNNKPIFTTKKNVISIDSLRPNTNYVIGVVCEGERAELSFRTEKESTLLDVTEFGAKGDGVTEDTAFLQAAISSCPKEGTVFFPRGTYYTRPLFLKSDITLWLGEGAVLLGDTDRTHYPILPGVVRKTDNWDQEYNLSTWEGNPLTSFASLITGYNVENVDIVGQGVIDGNGSEGDWWQEPKKKKIAWRPNTIFFNRCKNVRMQGVTIQNSPSWTIHPYYCENMTFLNLLIRNPSDSPNTDGFDPESCENVRLLGSVISVGDDCIAIKSGKMYMGQAHYFRTYNVEIRNCRLERGHGSVTIGSEVASGVEDVIISKCIFSKTDRGLRIKTRRGRGSRSIINRIQFQNIKMDQVLMPFTLNMFYFCDPDGHSDYVQTQNALPVDGRTPMIGKIEIEDVECTDVNASVVCAYGLPEMPIEEIALKNVKATFLPKEKQIATCPIMMDNFDAFSGKSFYIRNVERFTASNVEIIGAADHEPEMIQVKKSDLDIEYIGTTG